MEGKQRAEVSDFYCKQSALLSIPWCVLQVKTLLHCVYRSSGILISDASQDRVGTQASKGPSSHMGKPQLYRRKAVRRVTWRWYGERMTLQGLPSPLDFADIPFGEAEKGSDVSLSPWTQLTMILWLFWVLNYRLLTFTPSYWLVLIKLTPELLWNVKTCIPRTLFQKAWIYRRLTRLDITSTLWVVTLLHQNPPNRPRQASQQILCNLGEVTRAIEASHGGTWLIYIHENDQLAPIPASPRSNWFLWCVLPVDSAPPPITWSECPDTSQSAHIILLTQWLLQKWA